jgi:hypothetical protein
MNSCRTAGRPARFPTNKRDPQRFAAMVRRDLRASGRLAKPDDECAGEQERGDAKHTADFVQSAPHISARHHQHAPEKAQQSDRNGSPPAGIPLRCGGRAEHRDERQRVTDRLIEQVSQAQRCRQARERDQPRRGCRA